MVTVEPEQSYRTINTIVILELRIDSRTARASEGARERAGGKKREIRSESGFTLARVKP